MNQWQTFFKHEAPKYLENCFTRNTIAECDFIERELKLAKGQTILDIGCGTARHSLELTRRGYRCTGIDQSADMLSVAKSLAKEQGLEIEFIQGDAASTRVDRQFDHAICLCEGSLSLVEPGINPVHFQTKIVANIAAMVKTGGMFLLTALNGYRFARMHSDADVASGKFDPLFLTATQDYPADDGTVKLVEKAFMPIEIIGMLENADFAVIELWGGTAGNWNKQPLKLDEIELMVLCEKAPR